MIQMIDYALILSKNGISKTKFRINLINLFYSSNKSFSVDEILDYYSNSINKVTIYRALKDFETKDLIHRVPDKNFIKKYAISKNKTCHSNYSNHSHFVCYSCNETFCLDYLKNPNFSSLKGFKVKKLNITLEGYCAKCTVLP